eukprot:5569953-Amphidinium_carterae.1
MHGSTIHHHQVILEVPIAIVDVGLKSERKAEGVFARKPNDFRAGCSHSLWVRLLGQHRTNLPGEDQLGQNVTTPGLTNQRACDELLVTSPSSFLMLSSEVPGLGE